MITTRRTTNLTIACAVAIALTGLLHAAARAADAAKPPSTAGGGLPPSAARADLVLPPALVARVSAAVNHAGRPLGYTGDQMKIYGRDACRMRTVENLFRDATALPRESGRITDDLLRSVGALPADPAAQLTSPPGMPELTRLLFALTDVAAGRGYAPPRPESTATPAPASPGDAAAPAMRPVWPDTVAGWSITAEERTAWHALAPDVRTLVVRILQGADAAAPWMSLAWSRSGGGAPGHPSYEAVTAPWRDETNDQTATLHPETFELLRAVDRDYLAYGSIIYLTHAQLALDDFRAARLPASTVRSFDAPPRISFDTRHGRVIILGEGSEEVTATRDATGGAALILDLGGDTTWRGAHAVPASREQPFSLVIDLGGDDLYDAGDAGPALGCGFFGVGVICDLAGDDTYRNRESGIASAWFGTGLVFDMAGNDTYETQKTWSQGHAMAGVAALVDLGGDDRYSCGSESQAHGSTYGAALLLDASGNDAYVARDDGNVSALYLNQSVAMAQGCGHGRRADLGDGHSLAGGFGILVDAAGDDDYHAQVWAQGCAYWWGVGILEDRGGNDSYRNGKYSQGAAAHFAIGVAVDLAGDDRYNVGNDTAVNQYHGHARDGSIGVAVDGDGNDEYLFRNHCGGAGDLGSIGIFWDRRGDDIYRTRWNQMGDPNGWNETPSMGAATRYTPFRSFRDELMTVGVFLDTGGRDRYEWDGPADRMQGGDGREWRRDRGPLSWSYGADLKGAK